MGGEVAPFTVRVAEDAGSVSAVGVDDLESIVDAARQHQAQGFLLVLGVAPAPATEKPGR